MPIDMLLALGMVIVGSGQEIIWGIPCGKRGGAASLEMLGGIVIRRIAEDLWRDMSYETDRDGSRDVDPKNTRGTK